jgi:long-chain acyl-CoA synthetase
VSCGTRGEDRLIVVVLGSASSAARYTDARNPTVGRGSSAAIGPVTLLQVRRRRELLPSPALDLSPESLTARQQRWLEPVTGLRRLIRWLLFAVNRLAMRVFFRLTSVGLEHVPRTGAAILAPNHASSLDPFALAAALDGPRLARTWWAGWRQAVLRNPLRTFINRLAQTVPIDKDTTSLAVGAEILRRDRLLVWFPEGHRSPDGTLQPFKRGVGVLLRALNVPIIPVYLAGTYRAMPPDARLPRRFPRITVTFGRPLTAADLSGAHDPLNAGRGGDAGSGNPADLDQLVAELRSQVQALAPKPDSRAAAT